MNTVFRNIGVITVATESLYYICLASYLGFIAWPSALLIKSQVDCQSPYTVWILATSSTALISSVLFWKLDKGTTGSVIGMLCYLLNFISMIIIVISSAVNLS